MEIKFFVLLRDSMHELIMCMYFSDTKASPTPSFKVPTLTCSRSKTMVHVIMKSLNLVKFSSTNSYIQLSLFSVRFQIQHHIFVCGHWGMALVYTLLAMDCLYTLVYVFVFISQGLCVHNCMLFAYACTYLLFYGFTVSNGFCIHAHLHVGHSYGFCTSPLRVGGLYLLIFVPSEFKGYYLICFVLCF